MPLAKNLCKKTYILLKFLKGLIYPVSVNENVFSYASRGLIDPLKKLASTAWTLVIHIHVIKFCFVKSIGV